MFIQKNEHFARVVKTANFLDSSENRLFLDCRKSTFNFGVKVYSRDFGFYKKIVCRYFLKIVKFGQILCFFKLDVRLFTFSK